MKDKIQQNYESIKQAILNNLQTIRSLGKQAESLRSILEEMNGVQAKNKESLEQAVATIEKDVDSLITQTETLFNIYYDFISNL
jgi:predicted  nucleic acid-binding Zn-ribbon protein